MIENLIIGSGFSAIFSKLLSNKKIKIMGFKKFSKLYFKNQSRRKKFESNKLFSTNAFSYGSLNSDLKFSKLHDRLILGGNTNIWGGHINMKFLDKKLKKIFEKNNFVLKRLSFKSTGTISNYKDIYQIQDKDEKIINVKNYSNYIEDSFIEKISINKKKNIIVTFQNQNNKNLKSVVVKKLYLCIGTIQLIDLLYRSNFLKDNDIIQLSEFEHRFKLKSIFSKFDRAVVIRYHISRAIGHFLGIQYYSNFLKLFKFLPLCIDQNFYNNRNYYSFKINNGSLIEVNEKNKNIDNFGQSIHYCNMKINNIDINKYLSRINKNLYGAGMPFVKQKVPGPICNDIISDIKKKL